MSRFLTTIFYDEAKETPHFVNVYVDEHGNHYPIDRLSKSDADNSVEAGRLIEDRGVYRINVYPKDSAS